MIYVLRLLTVLHWAALLGTVGLTVMVVIGASISDGSSSDAELLFIFGLSAPTPLLGYWVLNFVITGEKHLMPWSKKASS